MHIQHMHAHKMMEVQEYASVPAIIHGFTTDTIIIPVDLNRMH